MEAFFTRVTMSNELANQIIKNAETILDHTKDERKIFDSIQALGKKIYLTNSVTSEDKEILASRALALYLLDKLA